MYSLSLGATLCIGYTKGIKFGKEDVKMFFFFIFFIIRCIVFHHPSPLAGEIDQSLPSCEEGL